MWHEVQTYRTNIQLLVPCLMVQISVELNVYLSANIYHNFNQLMQLSQIVTVSAWKVKECT